MNLRLPLYRVYWALERRLAPGLRYAQFHYEEAVERRVLPGASWLDIGCGWAAFSDWRLDAEREVVSRAGRVVGVDLVVDSLIKHRTISERYVANIDSLPFRDASFDVVTANMVVEHLTDPARSFAEVRRVLKPGGIFLMHTPNSRGHVVMLGRWLPEVVKGALIWLLQGRDESDVFPTHYRANTPEAIESLAGRSGLRVREMRLVESTAAFALFAPLAVVELLWIRATMRPTLARWRQNIIATLAV